MSASFRQDQGLIVEPSCLSATQTWLTSDHVSICAGVDTKILAFIYLFI